MATTVLKLKNNYGPAVSPNVITNPWLNFVANSLELLTTRLGDLARAGCFRSTDFVLTRIPGSLAAELSAGAGSAGAAGGRALLLLAEAVTIEGFPASAATVYVWLSLDTTGDPGAITVTISDDPADAPAGALLVDTCATNAAEIIEGSEDSLPAGRVNLIDMLSVLVDEDDQQGGKLEDKLLAGENITLTKTDGPSKQIRIDAAESGGGDFDVSEIGDAVAVDVPAGKSIVVDVDHSDLAVFSLAEPPEFTLSVAGYRAALLGVSGSGFTVRIEPVPAGG